MEDLLLANLLRGTASTILNIMLIFSLAESKYSKRITLSALGVTSALIMIMTTYFYVFHDLTTLARFDIAIWLVVTVGLKLMFKDSIIKWLFNVITVCNIALFIMIVSYALSRYLPYPMYANTVIRIILYLVFIILFKKLVYPLYRQVLDRWKRFLMVTVGLIVNYIYILVGGNDIAQTITENLTLLLIFSALMFMVYATIFWSLGSIIREYEFYNEKEQTELRESLMYDQLVAYQEFVEISKHHRHDLRHHNQIMLEYLKQGDLSGAEEYLNAYDTSLAESSVKDYCKNHIANALLCLYTQKTKTEEIKFKVMADIPSSLGISLPELGTLLSNVLENALEACRKVNAKQRFIIFTAIVEEESLKIEVKNSVNGQVEIKNNLPVSTKNGGGIGMKSVLRTVETYHGMSCLRQEGDTFITQIILPVA